MLDRAKRLSSSQDFQRMAWSKKIVSETEIPYKSYWNYSVLRDFTPPKPYLWDAFYKEKDSNSESEHPKWLHSNETFYLKIFSSVLLFITASFILKNFPTFYSLYNVTQHTIICIW